MNKVLKNTSTCADDDRINTYIENHKSQYQYLKSDLHNSVMPKAMTRRNKEIEISYNNLPQIMENQISHREGEKKVFQSD